MMMESVVTKESVVSMTKESVVSIWMNHVGRSVGMHDGRTADVLRCDALLVTVLRMAQTCKSLYYGTINWEHVYKRRFGNSETPECWKEAYIRCRAQVKRSTTLNMALTKWNWQYDGRIRECVTAYDDHGAIIVVSTETGALKSYTLKGEPQETLEADDHDYHVLASSPVPKSMLQIYPPRLNFLLSDRQCRTFKADHSCRD